MRWPGRARHPGWGRRKTTTCKATSKIGYRDEIDARIVLGIIRNEVLRERKEQRVYECPFCHRWHLTSQPPGRSRKDAGQEIGSDHQPQDHERDRGQAGP